MVDQGPVKGFSIIRSGVAALLVTVAAAGLIAGTGVSLAVTWADRTPQHATQEDK